jgi:hypothetical protein
MKNTLESLRGKRNLLHEKLKGIKNFRRGIISVNYRKCGKKNCACAQQGHPGHGPQYLWNTTIKGKSFAKHLRVGPELQKYKEETENYRVFLKICEELVETSEKICNSEPAVVIEDDRDLAELKKKLQMHFAKKLKKKLNE